ncbi:MAG: tetratricopeptide repeat protein [Pirellulaceae bacterium]
MLTSLKRLFVATAIATGGGSLGLGSLVAQENNGFAATDSVAVQDPYSIGFDDFDLSTVEDNSEPVVGAVPVATDVDIDAAIEQQQGRLRTGDGGRNLHAQVLLGRLWLRKAKEEDFLPGYQRSVDLLEEVTATLPEFRFAKQSLAESYLATHRFSDAARLVGELRKLAKPTASVLALEFDAHLELGNLEQALRSLAALQALEESPPVMARSARLRELGGDLAGAANLIRDAVCELEQLTDDPRSLVWYHWRLGQLHFGQGNLDAAKSALQRALDISPDDEASLMSMAHVLFAESDLESSEQFLRRAAVNQAPPVLAVLGDLMAVQGQLKEARQLWGNTLEAMDEEAKVAKVAHAREVAMFLADHQMDLDRASRLAELDFEQRQDAFAWDCRAWVAFRQGDLDAAQNCISRALDGVRGSSQVLYHAAWIACERGQLKEARESLKRLDALNPRFSITAARELDELRKKMNDQ